MTDYQITLTGELKPGTERDAAVSEFAKLFKLAPEKSEEIFSRAPVILKKGADEQTAKAFQNALDKIGLVAQIEPQGDELAPPAPNVPGESPSPTPAAEQPGFKFIIEGQPDYAMLTVQLPAGETVKVEASAMATMDTNIKMKTKAKGGLGGGTTTQA